MSEVDFEPPPRWIDRLPRRTSVAPTVPSRLPRLLMGRHGVDWRKTARQWARAGKPDFEFERRRAKRRPGRIAILWDVSGSMSDVRDVCLAFAYGFVQRYDQVGVFPFGTNIEDVTSALKRPFGAARRELARIEQVWAGGTNIGGVLTEFNERFGGRWLRPGTTIVVISDGWDVGQPEALATALRRMRQAGCNLFWLNPLQGTPGFQPRTRALRTAKPLVAGMYPGATADDFLRFAQYVQI
ncbi:VWA domain-containing protein [Alicyclobacillus sp. ALC3]|uniref:VWA domain-containing protein n=1 Tax=Alicyclobacillus sp. ALC3 TaxID=2796143 RepID=UPI002377EBEF|nr:VWA domain-containing protein [Alicyclobacillus sp. ALC3]WDL95770.1 VWA domain-containing protein [Alicyclobacillus sp. ALC3]